MAKKKIEKWIHNDPRNVKYCLKMDIKKFFPSIDRDILKNISSLHHVFFFYLLMNYELPV